MPGNQKNPSRRSLLEIGWRSLALAGVATQISSAARTSDGVLVCIYLLGGNDGNDLIVPLESAQYSSYAAMRGPLALNSDELLAFRSVKNPGEYGFHPALSELRDLYSQGALAAVANVGSPRPTGSPNGHEYNAMTYLAGGYLTLDFASARAGLKVADADRVITTDRGVSMLPLDGSRSIRNRRELAKAATSAKLETQFPDTSLGRALKEVAGLIKTASSGRALYTIAMGGFDTHRAQREAQPALFRELSSAISAFYSATQEMGVAHNVTTFTESEFGRSIRPNKAGGTGHGWGNHQLVVGGAVLGGDVFGTFPDMATADRDANGGWVPTTSRDLYLATLAGWSGLSPSELAQAFPGANGSSNLGFMA